MRCGEKCHHVTWCAGQPVSITWLSCLLRTLQDASCGRLRQKRDLDGEGLKPRDQGALFLQREVLKHCNIRPISLTDSARNELLTRIRCYVFEQDGCESPLSTFRPPPNSIQQLYVTKSIVDKRIANEKQQFRKKEKETETPTATFVEWKEANSNNE